MADEPKGGPAAGEEAGESVETTAPEPTETPGSVQAGADDAEAQAQAARDEYIANVASQAAIRAVNEYVRANGSAAPSAPAAPPPTAGQGVVAELTAERDAIAAEDARIQRAIQAEGLTAQNLLDHQNLVRREGRFYAQVNLEASRMTEQQQRVSKAGSEAEWTQFVGQFPPGTDVSLMRDAFEMRQARAKQPEKKPVPNLRRDPDRPIVDVSGPSAVSAAEKKARTMTSAQIEARKEQLRENDVEGYIKFGKQLRSREIIRQD